MKKVFNYVTGVPELQPLSTKEVDGARHYIIPTGEAFPSVTTVLGHFKKKQIQEWRDRIGHEEANRISNRASTRGTKFHSMMERYLQNKPIKEVLHESVMPDMRQAFHDIRPTLDRIDNIHYLECPLYSTKMRLAGRTDVIGEFDGTLSVIDFKTSTKIKPESYILNYFEQTTAYGIMYEERVGIPIDQIVVIISVDNEPDPQVFVKRKEEYESSLFQKIYDYHLDMFSNV
jgi:genome maintenance exonuclease 1